VVKSLLADFFTLEEDGLWHQSRCDTERAKWAAKREVKIENGKTGALNKWGNSEEMGKFNRAERLANARRLARHSAEEWQALLWICGGVCVKCGADDDIVKDHILPIYRGGSDGIENIQPFCRSCNAAKGPENVDYRPQDWSKCLLERLAKPLGNASPLPSPSPLPSLPPLTPPSAPEKKAKKQKTPARSVSDEDLAGTLPLVNGSEYRISKQDVKIWVDTFPGVEVKAELKKFKAWLYANPTRRKTERGINRAIFSWLEKEQNSSHTGRNGGNYAAVPNGRSEENLAVLAKSLIGTERQSPAHEDGLFSSGEDGQDNARTIHRVPAPARPQSVPSGNVKPFQF
jgi:hypothetical protein